MDNLTLSYRARVAGTVRVPGSKSIANRALLLAALAEGTTQLDNMLISDDTARMREALTELGVMITEVDTVGAKCTSVKNASEKPQVENLTSLQVTGLGGLPAFSGALSLFLGNAGTAMRPLAAVLSASSGEFELTGEPRMYERPIGPLVDALKSLGADIEYQQTEGFPPLLIRGKELQGGLLRVDGSMSSQYVSALLMLLPLLAGDTRLQLVGNVVSKPYIDLTIAMMRSFSARVEQVNEREFFIPGQQQYKSPGVYWIEGDASSASYFLAAGAIGQGPVTVEGVGSESLQGDRAFADVLEAMGAEVSWGARSIRVAAGKQDLQGGVFDLNHIPDAAMTIATTALFASGSTEIRNIANWRLKETDRLHAMATELRKCGADVVEGDDWIRITPPPAGANGLRHAEIATYDDHRMAMCFALVSFAECGVTILDPECCKKTYPNFFADFSDIVYSN
ncbi:3-phosphoshikimate 1-carboxyvinyltransferase [Aliidiomarina iranensis]|uniref:3-phosphoshikimate 1-carboxyvinyltransferase n=1 Tax=Aliidiomarina iranensis TaxID=1434071 RepID=A0A432VZZ9_9GAMM|nr:3-phosphoshikimate 1-carboxyvinyltransferase [Aliidiomarina iranensis]RUO22326.1 3-phosphoshikimate 1-carboxyvinyltransferase [Aliidiomarina iranensis]